MQKLIRFFNQNRRKVWMGILIIVAILLLIQLLNYFAKINSNKGEVDSGPNTIYNPNESMISDDYIPQKSADKINKTMDTFLDNCTKGQVDKAYEMLSKDCKEVLFPSLEYFKTSYYNKVFGGNKIYNFQSWSSDNKTYIYQVRILDNILSTGQYANVNAVEDYYTVVQEGEEYKLNINGYVGRREVKKLGQINNIKVEIKYTDVYMDYEIYTIKISNGTDKTILLDPQIKPNTMFLTDKNNIPYIALAHELVEEQLKVEAMKTKEISIKFNDNSGNSKKISKMTFSNIVADYNAFKEVQDKSNANNYMKIEIEM